MPSRSGWAEIVLGLVICLASVAPSSASESSASASPVDVFGAIASFYDATSTPDTAIATLSGLINTDGHGIPIIVYNPLAWARTDSVTVASPFTGEDANVSITDESGKSYPGRSLGDALTFTARDVPAMGYKVYWARDVMWRVSGGVSANRSLLTNQFFRIRLEPKLGVITSVYDLRSNRNVLSPGRHSDLLQVTGLSSKDLIGDSEVVCMDSGPAKVTVVFDHRYGKSVLTQEITLYDGVPRIDIKMTADWQDGAAEQLKAAFSTCLKNPKVATGASSDKWLDLSDSDYGLSILSDCPCGFDAKGNVMRVSILPPPKSTLAKSDGTVREMTYSLYPHKGDWRDAATVRRAYELNQPLFGSVVQPHSGKLPASKSFLSVSPAGIILSELKKSEDGGLIVRIKEVNGRSCEAAVRTGIPVKYYAEVDQTEKTIGEKHPIDSGLFRVRIGKNEIRTYKLLADIVHEERE